MTLCIKFNSRLFVVSWKRKEKKELAETVSILTSGARSIWEHVACFEIRSLYVLCSPWIPSASTRAVHAKVSVMLFYNSSKLAIFSKWLSTVVLSYLPRRFFLASFYEFGFWVIHFVYSDYFKDVHITDFTSCCTVSISFTTKMSACFCHRLWISQSFWTCNKWGSYSSSMIVRIVRG